MPPHKKQRIKIEPRGFQARNHAVSDPEPGEGGKPGRSAIYVNSEAADLGAESDGSWIIPQEAIEHGVKTSCDLFRCACDKHGDRQYLGWRTNTLREAPGGDSEVEWGPYEWMTYAQAREQVQELSRAFASLGVRKGHRIGLLGDNAPEWLLSLHACNSRGLVSVPMYTALGTKGIAYVVKDAALRAVCCSAAGMEKIAEALEGSGMGSELAVIYWGQADEAQIKSASERMGGAPIYSWKEAQAIGQQASRIPSSDPPQEEDLCTIMYTSGTTGDPKGVMLTHRNLVHAVWTCLYGIDQGTPPESEIAKSLASGRQSTILSYLPLAHSFQRLMEELYTAMGGRIGYYHGERKAIFDDAQALGPTFVPGAPKVFKKVMTAVQERVESAGWFRRGIYGFMHDRKRRALKSSRTAFLADALVFRKVARQVLGENCCFILSGSAPLPRPVEEFMRIVLCCDMVHGYGLTETTAVGLASLPPDPHCWGTVGVVPPGLQACIESVEDMGYNACPAPDSGVPPRGELLLKGDVVFQGYLGKQEATLDMLRDGGDPKGWLHTGDIVEMTPSGHFRIIDRRKDIFKLANGEFVVPAKIEGALENSPVVDQVWVGADREEDHLVAIVVPAEHPLRALAKDANLPGKDAESMTLRDLCHQEAVRARLLAGLQEESKRRGLKGPEVVQALALVPQAFTEDPALTTPTLKIKRPQLMHRYKDVIARLHAEVHAGLPAGAPAGAVAH